MSSKSCPICVGSYYNVDDYNKLCLQHQKSTDWYVTICKICGNPSFSTVVGMCIECRKITFLDHSEDIDLLSGSYD